jgi:hypothetical protein
MIQENPANWSQGFWGSEHPDTARLRVEKDYVETMVALKRENMDRISVYLNGLMEKAKEELNLARAGNNDVRRAALRQHVDEILAYLKGQALDVVPPPKHEEKDGPQHKGHYILDDIAPFFGRVRCVLDQWYDSHLIALYDEMLTLVKLKKDPTVR